MPLSHRGNTLSEYGLVGALIAVACIAAFLIFGQGLRGKVDGVKGDMGGHVMSARISEAQQNALESGSGSYPMQMPDGSVVNVPIALVMPTAQTAGSNGGEWSDTLTTALEQLAAELQAHDPALAALIRNMANSGHNIAAAERSLLAQCGGRSSCNATGEGGSGLLVNVGVLDYHAQAKAVSDYLAAHPGSLSPDLQRLIGVNNAIIVDIAGGFETSLTGDSTHVVMDPRVSSSTPTSINFHSNSNCGVQGVYTNCFH